MQDIFIKNQLRYFCSSLSELLLMIIFDKKGTNHEVPVYIPGTWGFILVRFALTHLVCLYYFFMGTDIKMCQHVKSQRHHFADKGPYSQSFGFPSSHVWMWELDHKEGRVLKNWCFQTVVLEKTFESPLDCQEIKPVNPKRNQPWIFIGRTDAEAEALEKTHWKRLWCWERLRARGEGDDRG